MHLSRPPRPIIRKSNQQSIKDHRDSDSPAPERKNNTQLTMQRKPSNDSRVIYNPIRDGIRGFKQPRFACGEKIESTRARASVIVSNRPLSIVSGPHRRCGLRQAAKPCAHGSRPYISVPVRLIIFFNRYWSAHRLSAEV